MLQVLKGDIKPAVETHEMLYQVMQRHTFIPEAFTTDFQVWQRVLLVSCSVGFWCSFLWSTELEHEVRTSPDIFMANFVHWTSSRYIEPTPFKVTLGLVQSYVTLAMLLDHPVWWQTSCMVYWLHQSSTACARRVCVCQWWAQEIISVVPVIAVLLLTLRTYLCLGSYCREVAEIVCTSMSALRFYLLDQPFFRENLVLNLLCWKVKWHGTGENNWRSLYILSCLGFDKLHIKYNFLIGSLGTAPASTRVPGIHLFPLSGNRWPILPGSGA